MHRFVAFVWDNRSEEMLAQVSRWIHVLQAESPRWTVALARPGLAVLSYKHPIKGAITTTMANSQGVVIGALFKRGHEKEGRVAHLTDAETRSIADSSGDDLIRNYWGNYVAIWNARTGETAHILRDPCGAVSCYKTSAAGIDIFCSYVADVALLPGLRVSIDWNAVRAFLLHNYFITPHTGLEQISELLPGQKLVWRHDREPVIAWAWNGYELAAKPQRRTFESAAADLRETAEACFTAWSKAYNNIVVRLSGGLDSSIVACLMQRAGGGAVTGVHLVSRGYEAFESRLARVVADHADIELVELETDDTDMDLRALLRGPRLARPTKQLLGASVDQPMMKACESATAECVMGGQGGDSLFLQRSIASNILSDYVRLNGLGRDFWNVAYESAVLLQCSVWRSLRNAGRFAVGSKRWSELAWLDDPAMSARSLLTRKETGLPHGYLSHPWLEQAQRLPPGKAEQLRGIVALRNYQPVRGYGLEYDAVHPFISQPIVEFALKTPTYLFAQGGLDRAMERRAFADLIPEVVAKRTLKGFINHSMLSQFARNADLLREIVLDGAVIAGAGLDRARCEHLLAEDQLVRGDGLDAIMNLLAAEAWLAPWRE